MRLGEALLMSTHNVCLYEWKKKKKKKKKKIKNKQQQQQQQKKKKKKKTHYKPTACRSASNEYEQQMFMRRKTKT